ncbi:MAG: isochorismatase family protein [Streptosporangiales bacterium]|nr:isochorismatase family protein [Streptosporangiales bacterium]
MAIPTIAAYDMPTEAELGLAQVTWQPDAGRAALLVHDMQHYFVQAFPADRPPVTDLVANIVSLRELATRLGMPVVYTAQPGRMTRAQRGLLHDFWGPGMGTDDHGRRIIDELAPGPQDAVLTKWRYSAFHGTTLANILHRYRRDQLVICGVYAHIGCLMTACDAFTQDIEPFLVADAVADFSLAQHRMGLDYATQRCAVTVTTRRMREALTASRAGSSSLAAGVRRDRDLAGLSDR